MKEKREKPSVELGTLTVVIQVLQMEIDECKALLNKKVGTSEDYLWLDDLEKAANDLKQAYTTHIEKHKIVNFPAYEKLVNAKKIY
jgi:FtsZ-binding cell division protein ZapB